VVAARIRARGWLNGAGVILFVSIAAGCSPSVLHAGSVDSGVDGTGSGGSSTGGTGASGASGAAGMTGAGGATGAGGSTGVGGMIGVGGAPGMGGMIGIGGAPGMGGMIGVGGAPGMGGMIGVGGSTGTGGANGVGGTTGAGGANDGDGGVDTSGSDGARDGATDGATDSEADAGTACPALPYQPPPSGLAVEFVPDVVVSTLAGSGTPGDGEGTGAAVGLDNPVSIALAPGGNVFVLEYDVNRVRRFTPAGVSSTVIANGVLDQPFGLAAATDDTLFLDTDRDPSGQKSSTTGTIWRVDVPAQTVTLVKADIGRPRGLARLPDGRLVLSDYRNHRLMLLEPQTGELTTLAGNGCPGFADGQGTAAQFNVPYGVAVRPDGAIVVADWGNHLLRTVALDGTVVTLAGDGTSGMVDGPAAQARFYLPEAVAVDGAGAIYVSDQGNHRIRRLAAGRVETLAGDGMAGFADGPGAGARFYGQEGLAVTADGTTVYVADGTDGDSVPYHRVREIVIAAP
jgi:sugar lactone lactonase YvrE